MENLPFETRFDATVLDCSNLILSNLYLLCTSVNPFEMERKIVGSIPYGGNKLFHQPISTTNFKPFEKDFCNA